MVNLDNPPWSIMSVDHFRNWKPWLFSISMREFTPQGECFFGTYLKESKIFKHQREKLFRKGDHHAIQRQTIHVF